MLCFVIVFVCFAYSYSMVHKSDVISVSLLCVFMISWNIKQQKVTIKLAWKNMIEV